MTNDMSKSLKGSETCLNELRVEDRVWIEEFTRKFDAFGSNDYRINVLGEWGGY